MSNLIIQREDVEDCLRQYGCSLDYFTTGEKKNKLILWAEKDWIYLIHHMHQPDKEEDMEILHHCYMFEKKNLKGVQYSQKHKKYKKVFLHVLDISVKDMENAPKIVYDHLNNAFKVKIMEIDKEQYAVIVGPEKVKDIKWSEQDKG